MNVTITPVEEFDVTINDPKGDDVQLGRFRRVGDAWNGMLQLSAVDGVDMLIVDTGDGVSTILRKLLEASGDSQARVVKASPLLAGKIRTVEVSCE